MTANDKVKQFDCIKMKSSIQKQVYEETKNMSVKELLCYFNGSDKNLEVPVVKKSLPVRPLVKA